MSQAHDPSRWRISFFYLVSTNCCSEKKLNFAICTLSKMNVSVCFSPFKRCFPISFNDVEMSYERIKVSIFPRRRYFWSYRRFCRMWSQIIRGFQFSFRDVISGVTDDSVECDRKLSVVFSFLFENLRNTLTINSPSF